MIAGRTWVWVSSTPVRAGFAAALGLALAASAEQPVFAQGTTMRVSVSFAGEEANAQSLDPVISADGRYVAYVGHANNLTKHLNNGWPDIFVHDRSTGHVELITVSLSHPNMIADSYSQGPSISDNGRYVAFSSQAANLVLGDTNGLTDIFVRDRQSGVTTRVSVSSAGAQTDEESNVSVVSGDGRYVAFASKATTLVPGGPDDTTQVFVHDRLTGATTCVSVDSAGAFGNLSSGEMEKLAISSDGRYVAFNSVATNLVPNDTNGKSDVFLHDRTTGQTTRVSVSTTGAQGNGNSLAPSLSADGNLVAFASVATNIHPSGTNGWQHIYVRNRATSTTFLVTSGLSGAGSNESSYDPRLTPNGNFLAFSSSATNLVVGDTNASGDIFLYDLQTSGPITRVGLNSANTENNGSSFYPALSSDARFIAFYSVATNVVPGDTNAVADVFLRDRIGCSPTVANYCTAGTTTQGCVPQIGGLGTPSATASSGFTISVVAMEAGKAGLLFYGVSGPLENPWNGSSSFLCVKTPVQRTGVQDSGGTSTCDGSMDLDWNAYAASNPQALGMPFAGSETVWVQGWFRDPQAPGGTNLSDGLWFQVCP